MNKSLSLKFALLILILFSMSVFTGCRSQRTEKRPFHLNPNLDWQAKYKEQSLSLNPPDGTIPWGNQKSFSDSNTRKDYIKTDQALYFGRNNDGSWVSKVPMKVDVALMDRGQERFNIYCAACHTRTGDGTKSQISKRGWVIPNLLQDLTVKRSDGELFDIISNGVRTMPGYRKQVSEQDRWAIVAYLRALQQVKRGRLSDVPRQLRNKIN
jgi:mono/diheme cytochrome c family protein